MNPLYLVSGLGVSFICPTFEAAQFWINEILDKGGVPQITELTQKVTH